MAIPLARDRRPHLESETVEVERVPINREVSAAPAIRQEVDVTIIPLVEEVVVVEKRLVLREEIRIHKRRSTERATHTVNLRAEAAEITLEALPDASSLSNGPKESPND